MLLCNLRDRGAEMLLYNLRDRGVEMRGVESGTCETLPFDVYNNVIYNYKQQRVAPVRRCHLMFIIMLFIIINSREWHL
jgi:hypothetical protein